MGEHEEPPGPLGPSEELRARQVRRRAGPRISTLRTYAIRCPAPTVDMSSVNSSRYRIRYTTGMSNTRIVAKSRAESLYLSKRAGF
jgi:hypothetical protein